MGYFLKKCTVALVFCIIAVVTACSRCENANVYTEDELVTALTHSLVLYALRDAREDIVYTIVQSETLVVDAGNIFGRLEQEITFYATSKMGLAWTTITQTDVLIDSDAKILSITLPTPHVIRIEPDHDRTYFAEQTAGILRRTEIVITEEEKLELRMSAINNMKATLESEHVGLAKATIEEIVTEIINNLLIETDNVGSFVLRVAWN